MKILNSKEISEISDPAFEKIPNDIVNANSPEVDIVSGATNTSKAIIEAVKMVLEKAQ